MKDNTGPSGACFLHLENKMKALEEAGVGGAELKKVQDEVAELILKKQNELLKRVKTRGLSNTEQEDLITELIILFYDKYQVRRGRIYPFLLWRLDFLAKDKKRKKSREVLAKEQKEDQPDYLMENTLPDEKMNQERDVIANCEADEAFWNLSALVTRFFDERDRRSGKQKRFRYYKAAYTQGVFDYVKDGLEEPPVFQHEADIVGATDEAFANFVTLHQPYSSEEPLTIQKIFINKLEYNREVAPSYVKNNSPDDVIAIPMKPFVIGGFMERVHHMKVDASLVTQQMNRYKDDAATVLYQIGIESKRYKKNKKEKGN